jgi:membrane-associated phospholipid phosphatase
MREDARRLIRIKRELSPRQRRLARFWEGGEGTSLPPGIWIRVMTSYLRDRRLSTARAARVFALLTVAMADAGVASWDSKYAYWYPRPEPAIRGFKPYLRTPSFPAYVSGHATYSAAAGEVLAHLFPHDAATWRRRGLEAGQSRSWGGIHWTFDGTEGARMGRRIGRLVVDRARADGAE